MPTERLSRAFILLAPLLCAALAPTAAAQQRQPPARPASQARATQTPAPAATPSPQPSPQSPSQTSAETPSQPARQVSEDEADLAITASVTAQSLRFEVVPNVSVEFPGRPRRETAWEAERTNLPRPVQPGVTYRDVGVRLKIVSVFADIDRIVAEALGEVPPSDDGARPNAATPSEPPPDTTTRANDAASTGRTAATNDANATREKMAANDARPRASASRRARTQPSRTQPSRRQR